MQSALHKKITIFITTFGGVGFFPYAPGTAGTMAAAFVFFFVGPQITPILTMLMLVVGLILCKQSQLAFGSKDPNKFVLDEAVGMGIAIVGFPFTWKYILASFCLFRLFDITKPIGVNKLDAWKHPHSIMWDDVLAGVYANLVLRVILYLAGI